MKNLFLLILTIFINSFQSLIAQCATCKAAAETSLAEGNTTIASGINLGVLYMLSILFFIFGIAVFIIWKHRYADGSISK